MRHRAAVLTAFSVLVSTFSWAAFAQQPGGAPPPPSASSPSAPPGSAAPSTNPAPPPSAPQAPPPPSGSASPLPPPSAPPPPTGSAPPPPSAPPAAGSTVPEMPPPPPAPTAGGHDGHEGHDGHDGHGGHGKHHCPGGKCQGHRDGHGDGHDDGGKDGDEHGKKKDEKSDAVPLKLVGKFGEGVGVEAVDGSFGLTLKSLAQLRSTVGVPLDSEDGDPSADFALRRLLFTLEGHAFGKLVELKIQLGLAERDFDPVAPYLPHDAFVTINPIPALRFRVGQMKVPYARQPVVSSGSHQMVDRSVVTSEFQFDRDVGVQVFSDDLLGNEGMFGYNFGVFGGDGRDRISGGYGLLYAGRLVFRPIGGSRGEDLDEVDFKAGMPPRLAFGASGAFNHLSDRARSTLGDVFETGTWANYLHAGGDASFKWNGLSVTGEVFVRDALTRQNTAEIDGVSVTDIARAGYGGFAQAGQLFAKHYEVSVRGGGMARMGAGESGMKEEKELGGALSYYGVKHALKVQLDTFYLWETWGEGKIQTRLQLQIAP